MRLNELLGGDFEAGMSSADLNHIRISGITCDSSAVHEGYLFAAIPGTQTDGRQFIPDALNRGAAAVLAPPGTLMDLSDARVPLLLNKNPRRQYARMAARFYDKQPKKITCVTGTNGKTSVVSFLRQIWAAAGHRAASSGTLGVELSGYPDGLAPKLHYASALTTPDPADLHRSLAELSENRIEYVGIEASSHGLAQYRLDGVRPVAAAFTNLTRDHLDYHGDEKTYLAAKLRLFSEILVDHGSMIINADAPEADLLRVIASKRQLRVIDYGVAAEDLVLMRSEVDGSGQKIELKLFGARYQVRFPLPGDFQVANALAALGLGVVTGVPIETAVTAIADLKSIRGRLEYVTRHPSGAAIYVDYAHTPNALKNVLKTLKPHLDGDLHLVFGCGGDRDPGKRYEMGLVAASTADHVVVTDDNPRSEDPAQIRRAIITGCPEAKEIQNRAEAIFTAVSALQPDDILIVAGKGHEVGQVINGQTLPFDDAEVIRRSVEGIMS